MGTEFLTTKLPKAKISGMRVSSSPIMAFDTKSPQYNKYVEAIREAACSYITRNFLVTESIDSKMRDGVTPAEHRVVKGALNLIRQREDVLSIASQQYLTTEVYKTRDAEMVRRDIQRGWLTKKEEAVKSRRTYRWQVALASTEKEKARLRRERRQYIARRWYSNNKSTELAKCRVRNRLKRDPKKACCPYLMLGAEQRPIRGVRMWITKCGVCERLEYGEFGFDKQLREGLHFRGLWFKDIDPDTGMGTTMDDNIISLTRIY